MAANSACWLLIVLLRSLRCARLINFTIFLSACKSQEGSLSDSRMTSLTSPICTLWKRPVRCLFKLFRIARPRTRSLREWLNCSTLNVPWYTGKIDNSKETMEINKTTTQHSTQTVPWARVDEVDHTRVTPQFHQTVRSLVDKALTWVKLIQLIEQIVPIKQQRRWTCQTYSMNSIQAVVQKYT